MIARLRQLRFLALLLIAGSPGVGGMGVQSLHPCSAEMPWLASEGEHAGHAGHDRSADGPEAPIDCHCIGSCATAAPAPAPAVSTHRVAGVTQHARPRFPGVALPSLLLPIDRFPPKTAPPSS